MYHSSDCPTCGSDDVVILSHNPITLESAQQCLECGEEWFVDDEGESTLFDDADYIYEDADEDEGYLSDEEQAVLNGDNPDSLNGAY